jgi:hypothetical protein
MKVRPAFLIGLTVLTSISPAATAPAAETPTGTWAKIYSPDIPTYATNLRAAGVPEATVGVLVSQEINARFKAREQALEPSLSSLQTLKEGWSAERREALVQLKREKNDLLRATLGAVPNETAKIEVISPSLAAATPAQREVVRLIIEDYNAMVARIVTESRGYLLEEDKEKLRYLEDEVSTDLIKAVGPAVALDYQVERDPYMRATRQRLELFQPTLAELRDIFVTRRNLGLDVESRSPSISNQLVELQRAVNEKLAALWGPERYAVYRRASSRQFQAIFHLVRRMGLDLKLADQIYDSQVATTEGAYQKMQERRTAGPIIIRNGERPPNPGDIAKAMIQEHCDLVKKLLGEAGYNQYYQLNSRIIDIMKNGGIIRTETNL